MNPRYRKPMIAGNWKMNMLASELKAYADALKPASVPAKWCETLLCVPAPLVPGAARAFKSCRVAVGGQNLSEYASGAYTGEISGPMLRDAGAEYVIVGHSERRAMFGETDEEVNRKVKAALDCGLKPVICVGETRAQKMLGVTTELVTLQLRAAVSGLTVREAKQLVVAYEPVLAIGTGMSSTPEEVEQVASVLRAVIRRTYGAAVARGTRILYGGSMNEKNASELLAQPDIDGGLVGGASLHPDKFAQIIAAARGE